MRGSQDREQDPRVVYAEIIDLPHWDPAKHLRMSQAERAAQFAPYAALVGYGDMVKEEERLTGEWTDLGEDEAEEVSRQLAVLAEAVAQGGRPVCSISYFVPDERKDGGEIRTVQAAVKRLDPVHRKLVLMTRNPNGINDEIDLDRILELTNPLE